MYKTYPEDFFLLQRQIRMRKVDEALMQIAIVSNPHLEDRDQAADFVNTLMDQRRFMRGEEIKSAELDTEAFEAFRGGIQKDSKIKVK
jgi:hypothetical protein